MKLGLLCQSGDTEKEWGPLCHGWDPLCHSGDTVAGQGALLPRQGLSRDMAEDWGPLCHGSGGQGQWQILVGYSFRVACSITEALIN